MVTGTVAYSNGFSATREDPGEEAGIEDVSLRDAFGTDLDPEMIPGGRCPLHRSGSGCVGGPVRSGCRRLRCLCRRPGGYGGCRKPPESPPRVGR